MKIIYFDENDTDIPLDLINPATVAKITGYKKSTLRPSGSTILKLKQYCPTYKHKNKKSHCIFYSKQDILEFLNYEGLERGDTFNSDNYYTTKQIMEMYKIGRCHMDTIWFLILKFKTTDLVSFIHNIKCYRVKNYNYIDKKSVERLLKTLGYKKRYIL